jgi:hypothetical protein
MLLQSLIANDVIAFSQFLAAGLVCLSWASAFRLLQGAEQEQALNPAVLISGFGRF